MQRRFVLGWLAAGLAFGVACGDDNETAAPPPPETFRATMNAAQEKPNPTTSTATGSAEIIVISPDTVSFKITASGMTNLTAGHFHAINSASGTGPVVFGFFASNPPQATFSGTVAEGRITRQSTFTGIAGFNFDSLMNRLRANP